MAVLPKGDALPAPVTPDRPKLPTPVKRQLNDELEGLLDRLKIAHEWPDITQFDEFWSFHSILARHSPWREHLEAFDFYDIVADAVKRLGIHAIGPDPQLLSELIDPKQFADFKKGVRETLLSIPRPYTLYVELPSMPAWGAGRVRISDRIELLEQVETPAQIPLPSIFGAITPPRPPQIFICVRASGYGASRVDTTAVTDGLSHLKQFMAMFRRRAIFKEDWGLVASGPVQCWLIDDHRSDERLIIRLPENLARFFARVSIKDEKLQYFDPNPPNKTLLTIGAPRAPNNRAEREEAFKDALGRWIATILDAAASPDVDRVRAAFEWSFDSGINDNQTLAFLQTCIGLEALLGDDQEDEPLVSRLADRCAYLLGKTHSDRASIRERFKDMYRVRSKLVHGRAARLDLSDSQYLRYAQSVLSDVITEEADRLLRALEKAAEKKADAS